MKGMLFAVSMITLASSAVFANNPKVIYGNDDREDVVNVYDNLWVDKSSLVKPWWKEVGVPLRDFLIRLPLQSVLAF